MKLKALRNFKGPEGAFNIGEIFEAKADRGKWLVDNGFAVKVEAPVDTSEAPAAPAVKAPAKRTK